MVLEVIAEVTGGNVADLDDSRALDDLGVSGLVLLDVVEAVTEELGERTVGLDIDDDALTSARTVGELVKLVEDGLAQS